MEDGSAGTGEQTNPGEIETSPQASQEENDKEETAPISLEQRRLERERERAAQLSEENRSLAEKLKEAQSKIPEKAEPKIDDYESEEDYLEAKAEYIADQRALKREEESAQKEADRKAREYDTSVSNRVNDFKAKVPDFDKVVDNCTVNFPQGLVHAMRDSEKTGELMYNLAKNEAEAEKIVEAYKKSPWQGMKALSAYEDGLEKAKPGEGYKPPTTLGGGGGGKVTVEQKGNFSSQAEYEKMRMRQ